MRPEEMLKKTTHLRDEIEKAKRMHVAVGLPKGTATSAIYGGGMTVVQIGTIHEFGADSTPARSFLRVPFKVKADMIRKTLAALFRGVIERGESAENQLEKAGVMLENISKESFETKGFGTWRDIKAATKNAKGSSAILIDTGILRGSITSEVRGAS